MFVRVGILVFCIMASMQPALAHDVGGSWRAETPLPAPRAEVGVAASAGNVFVIAGVGPTGLVNTLFIFDVASGTWRQGAPLPGAARDHVGAVFLGGELYAIGGLTYWPGGSVSDVYAYDPHSDSWETRAPLPRPRGALGAAAIHGKLYAAGGLTDGEAVHDLTIYDPEFDSWRTLAPMPTARDHLMVGALAGRLHAVGGRNRDIGAIVDSHEVYDPDTNAWTTKAPLPTARGGGGAAVLNGLLYVFGGEFSTGTFANNEVYDPQTNTWHAHAPLPTARHGTQGAVVNGRIYVPGGGPQAGFSSSDIVDSYFSVPQPARCPTGGSIDSDGDGFTDAAEVAASTDPCNETTFPSPGKDELDALPKKPELPPGELPPGDQQNAGNQDKSPSNTPSVRKAAETGGCANVQTVLPPVWLFVLLMFCVIGKTKN